VQEGGRRWLGSHLPLGCSGAGLGGGWGSNHEGTKGAKGAKALDDPGLSLLSRTQWDGGSGIARGSHSEAYPAVDDGPLYDSTIAIPWR
jgi:hypothetical protein